MSSTMNQPCRRSRAVSLIDQIPTFGQPGNCGLRDPDNRTPTLCTEGHIDQSIAPVSSHDDNLERPWRHVDYKMFMTSRAGRWGVEQQVSRGGLVSLIPMLKEAQTYPKTVVNSEKGPSLESDSPHRLTEANLQAWTHARHRDDSPSYDSDASANSSRDFRRSRRLDSSSRQIQTTSQYTSRDHRQQPMVAPSTTLSNQQQSGSSRGRQRSSI